MMQYRLKRYSIKIKNYFSEIRYLKLTWLKIIVFILTATWFLSFFRFILTMFNIPLNTYFLWPDAALIIIYIYYLAYCTLRQPEIFMKVKDLENEEKPAETSPAERNKNRDSEILKLLVDYMNNEKPYKNNSLTLTQLSKEMNIPAHHLTRIIACSGGNFYSFINSYRISEAKKLLSDSSKRDKTVLELAFEAGFNSKNNIQ